MALHLRGEVTDDVDNSLCDAHLLDAKVRWPEQEFGHGKSFVVHTDDLLTVVWVVLGTNVASADAGEIRENVVDAYVVLLTPPLSLSHIPLKVGRHEASVFLQLINYVRFVHDV